jgi:hypothetical protein
MGPQLGDIIRFSDSYAMTTTVSENGQRIEMSGRFFEGDVYWEFQQDGQQIAWYLIGDDGYVVMQGQCFSGTNQSFGREDVDPDGFSADASANPTIEPVGTETIDGEEVLVYELSPQGAADPSETLTYYVLADSGYLRRITSETIQWDFHSWGAVEPIQKPEGDCQPIPGDGAPTPPPIDAPTG